MNNTVGNVNIRLDTRRITGNLRNAQKKLNMQVVADCTPLVPFQNGSLRSSVIYPQGIYGGEIEWNAPHAHFQYIGLVRTDSSGRTWVGKGESKPILTEKPLQYHQPGTGSQWFEKSKRANLRDWERIAREEAGRG